MLLVLYAGVENFTVAIKLRPRILLLLILSLWTTAGALVTGGGTGLGYAMARELLSLGANVVIASRNLERLEAAVAQLQHDTRDARYAGKVYAVECNLRKAESIAACVSAALQHLGRYFCAGYSYVQTGACGVLCMIKVYS